MKEILPGIYMMPMALPGFTPDSVNTYIIETPQGLISIDTGMYCPQTIDSTQKQLAEIGASFSDIKKVLITHGHVDHMGLVLLLKENYGTRYYLHLKDYELGKIRFTDVDNYISLTDVFLKKHGVPAGELPRPEVELTVPPNLFSTKPDIFLHGGESIRAGRYTLRVINTPGHTMGHVIYYEPNKKFLFSGDMLLPTIATNPAVHVQHIQNPLKQYIDSLKTMKALDIDLVLPGHESVFSNPYPRIEELIRDNIKKNEVIRRTFDDRNAKTAYEVSRILAKSARTGESYWDKFAGWDRRFAVLQSVSYLESLKHDGKLRLEIKDDTYYYLPAELKPPRTNIS